MTINSVMLGGFPDTQPKFKRITIRRTQDIRPYHIVGTDLSLCPDAEKVLKELDEMCIGDEITYELTCVRKQRKCKQCDGKGVY